MDCLKILTWNSNGLLNHLDELQVVLNIQKIDICLISESHLTNQSYVKMKGFNVYHTVHPNNNASGGSAIIIRESLPHYEELKFSTNSIQATIIKLNSEMQPLTVASLYSPPRHSITPDEYLYFLNSLGDRFIVGGDFNAKHTTWGSRLITTKGRTLIKAIRELNCEALSGGNPTYWPTDPNKIPDLIDFFIVKNISKNYIKVQDLQHLSSDHSPVLLTLSNYIVKGKTIPNLVNSKTDWIKFKQSLENRIVLNVPLQTEYQLDLETHKLVEDIQLSAWENTPDITKRTMENNYSFEIRNMIKEKRRARKKWHMTRAPQDKNIFNWLSRHLKNEIKNWKNNNMNTYLSNLTSNKSTDYSLWKATKNMKRPITQIPPIRKLDGSWARSNEQKANTFAEHLVEIFKPNSEDTDEEWVTNYINHESQTILPTTINEVHKIISSSIDPKKSPGFDLITGKILRELPRKALSKLCHLINASFRLKYVPQLWKVAEVIMILKPGKIPHNTSSYRPISLLPVISKVFEKVLAIRLNEIITRKNLIPDHQFGFRSKHSTIDQIHRITNIIENALEAKNVCSVLFLDVAQAFDKVWHSGLIFKLNQQLPIEYADILRSYLTDRYFRVKQKEEYSSINPIKAGVPQGSVLGPILYLLYTNDIPDTSHNTIATFADDTAILSIADNNYDSIKNLQLSINKIQDWTKKWKIKLNQTKSVHVDFTTKKIHYIPVYINLQPVPYTNSAKYLGMTLDTKLKWKEHVKIKLTELNIRYKKLFWLIGRSSNLNVTNKLLIYQQILKPIWTYGIQLWGCTCKTNRNLIQRFQNKVLRDIVDAPWYIRNDDLHRDLKVNHVTNEIKKIARSHHNRLHSHVNVEAAQLINNDGITRRLIRVKPFELL